MHTENAKGKRHAECFCKIIHDRDTYQELSRNVRGGLALQRVRHAQSDTEHKIVCVDQNALYSYASKCYLPFTAPRKITNEEELNAIPWRELSEQSDVGYFVCCDLEYPPEIHAKLRQLPIILEVEEICYQELSP